MAEAVLADDESVSYTYIYIYIYECHWLQLFLLIATRKVLVTQRRPQCAGDEQNWLNKSSYRMKFVYKQTFFVGAGGTCRCKEKAENPATCLGRRFVRIDSGSCRSKSTAVFAGFAPWHVLRLKSDKKRAKGFPIKCCLRKKMYILHAYYTPF